MKKKILRHEEIFLLHLDTRSNLFITGIKFLTVLKQYLSCFWVAVIRKDIFQMFTNMIHC